MSAREARRGSRGALPAFVAVVALAILPLAAAQAGASTTTLAFGPGFTQANLRSEGTVQGENATAVRRAIDSAEAGGDADGIVTEGEAKAFLVAYREVFSQKAESGVKGGNLTLDGRPPTTVALADLSMRGAAGPVGSGRPLVTVVDLHLLFQPANGTTHVLESRVAAGSGLAAWTLRLPVGYAIASAAGLPEGAAYGPDRTSVGFTAGAGHRTFTFAPLQSAATSQAAPLPAPLALAAIAACALLRRGVAPIA